MLLSQQVENKNLEIESVSQDLNDVLLEIAQKQQQKNFLQQNIRRTEEEIHRLNQEKKQILRTVQIVRLPLKSGKNRSDSCRNSQKQLFYKSRGWMRN
ncbi:MAG: hypothetical protein ACLUD0_03515 [Eubacterium ramulus]